MIDAIATQWERFERWWLHPDFYTTSPELDRARIMLVFCVVPGIVCLGIICSGWLIEPEKKVFYLMVGTGHVVTCGSCILLRHHSSVRIPSIFMVVTATIQLFNAALLTGAEHSPVLFVYPLATVFFGVIGGRSHAMFIGTFLSIGAIVLWRIDTNNLQLGAGEQPQYITILVLLWSILTSAGLAIYTQSQANSLLNQIKTELDRRTKAQQETELANQAKDMFIAYLSHEIRNPLAVIMGSIDLMSIPTMADRRARHMASLRSAAGGLVSLLDDILDFSSIERNRLSLKSSTIDLSTMMHELHREFEGQANTKGLRLAVEVEENIWAIGDKIRLRQVMVNLLSNAIKFTQRGQVTISARTNSKTARISVEDSGIGIAKEHQVSIFQPFERTRPAQAPGTGLGLAICRGLVEKMQSELVVESTLGSGSAFSFSLPIALKPTERTPANAPLPHHSLSTLRVLVVDDNREAAELFAEHCATLGCQVAHCFDGKTALQLSNAWSPDVILLDLEMPEMTGQEVINEIQSRVKNPPHIVVITGNAHRPDDMFIHAILTKPISLEQIKGVLIGLSTDPTH